MPRGQVMLVRRLVAMATLGGGRGLRTFLVNANGSGRMCSDLMAKHSS